VSLTNLSATNCMAGFYLFIYLFIFYLRVITRNKTVVFWQYSGVYGIVLRVKILFNKKDTALIQFADPVQAQNGKAYLYFCFYAMSALLSLVQQQKEHSACRNS